MSLILDLHCVAICGHVSLRCTRKRLCAAVEHSPGDAKTSTEVLFSCLSTDGICFSPANIQGSHTLSFGRCQLGAALGSQTTEAREISVRLLFVALRLTCGPDERDPTKQTAEP